VTQSIQAEFLDADPVRPSAISIGSAPGPAHSADWLAPGAWMMPEAPRQIVPTQPKRETGARAREKARVRGLSALDYLTGGHPNAMA
jgi:hypothetical protein